jgi:hypothetical protein
MILAKTAIATTGIVTAGTLDAESPIAIASPTETASGSARRAARGSLFRRFVRAALAAILVGGLVVAAPPGPAWAKDKKNTGVIPKEEGDSNVAAYFIVICGILVGLTAVCRRNYRTAEPKRPGSV